MGTKKEILKKVLKEGGKGTVLGTGLGFLGTSGVSSLENTAKKVNPIFGGGAGEISKEFLGNIDRKAVPLMTGLGVGSYQAGKTLIDELRKSRGKKNKKRG
ncbi:MAG: hypothetical protein ACOCT9_00325 [archaeon]